MADEIQEIKIGDRIRSYDFESVPDCYVEGVVIAITSRETHPNFPDCPRYEVQATRHVWMGEDVPVEGNYYPPVNGTPKAFGGVCNFVRKLEG